MSGGQQFVGNASVVLDANGNGSCSVGPQGVDWVVKLTAVSTSAQGTTQPQANTYRGGVSPANLIDGTYSGSGDTSDTVTLLQPGDQLFCEWTGGVPGSRAFLRVSGMSYPAGQGAANM